MPAGSPRRHRRFRGTRIAVPSGRCGSDFFTRSQRQRVVRPRRSRLHAYTGVRGVDDKAPCSSRPNQLSALAIGSRGSGNAIRGQGKSLRTFRANRLVRRRIDLPVVGARSTPQVSSNVALVPSPASQRFVAIAMQLNSFACEMPFFKCFAKARSAMAMCRQQSLVDSSRLGAATGRGQSGGVPEKKRHRIVDRPKNRD